MTKVYAASISALNDRSLYEYYYNLQPPARKSKTDKLRFDNDKLLCVGAWALLTHASENEGVTDISNIIYNENGKPCFYNNDSIHFNLSHSGKYVMCAISDKPVGCDVEKIESISLKVAEKFFSSKETADILSCKDINQQKDLFFRYWTLKESYLKAIGKGLKIALNEFSIKFDNSGISVEQNENNVRYYLKEFTFDSDYKFACCSSEPTISELIIVELNSIITKE